MLQIDLENFLATRGTERPDRKRRAEWEPHFERFPTQLSESRNSSVPSHFS